MGAISKELPIRGKIYMPLGVWYHVFKPAIEGKEYEQKKCPLVQ